MCDQLRAFEVGCYGNEVIRTPNIDRLADGGVRFETAVTNNSVCTPARSCLLSGQYSRTSTGMVHNTSENPGNAKRVRLLDATLAECFKAEGYTTSLIGKWHIDPQPQLVGFDEAVYPRIEHLNYDQTYYEPGKKPVVVHEFGPWWEFRRVEGFLKRNKSNPFFLFYNISPPHGPIGPKQMADKYLAMYKRDQMRLRPNTVSAHMTAMDQIGNKITDPESRRANAQWWFNVYTSADFWWRYYKGRPAVEEDKVPDGFDLRDLTALYYSATSCVDDMVGGLMRCLSENGLTDNTIVVFLSDHGDNLGSHGWFNKDILLEESIRIPMIVHWPAVLAPYVNNKQIAQIIDIAPSLLDLCGLDIPVRTQGRSLAAVLRQETDVLDDNVAFIETDSWQLGIRTPSHLYGIQLDPKTRRVLDDRLYFFNMETDNYQENNMAKTNKESSTAELLRTRLIEWHETTEWLDVPKGHQQKNP